MRKYQLIHTNQSGNRRIHSPTWWGVLMAVLNLYDDEKLEIRLR